MKKKNKVQEEFPSLEMVLYWHLIVELHFYDDYFLAGDIQKNCRNVQESSTK